MAGIQNAAEEFLKYARLQKERKERAERAFGRAGEKILSAAKAAGTGKTGVGQKVSRVGGAKSAGQTSPTAQTAGGAGGQRALTSVAPELRRIEWGKGRGILPELPSLERRVQSRGVPGAIKDWASRRENPEKWTKLPARIGWPEDGREEYAGPDGLKKAMQELIADRRYETLEDKVGGERFLQSGLRKRASQGSAFGEIGRQISGQEPGVFSQIGELVQEEVPGSSLFEQAGEKIADQPGALTRAGQKLGEQLSLGGAFQRAGKSISEQEIGEMPKSNLTLAGERMGKWVENAPYLSLARDEYESSIRDINLYYDTQRDEIVREYELKYGPNQEYSMVDQIELNNRLEENERRRQSELNQEESYLKQLTEAAVKGESIQEMMRAHDMQRQWDEQFHEGVQDLLAAPQQSLEGKITLDELKRIYLGEMDIEEVDESIRGAVYQWMYLKAAEEQTLFKIEHDGIDRRYHSEYLSRIQEAQEALFPSSKDIWGKLKYHIGNVGRGIAGGLEDALRFGVSSAIQGFEMANIFIPDTPVSRKDLEKAAELVREQGGVLQIEGVRNYQDLYSAMLDAAGGKVMADSWTGDWQDWADEVALALPADRRLAERMNGVGRMIPASVLAAATGGASIPSWLFPTIYTFASTAGSGAREAYLESGDTDAAWQYGALKGAVEAGIERLGGLKIPGLEGSLGDISGSLVDDICARLGASEAGRGAAKFLLNALEEGGEEALSAWLDPYLKRVTYDPNAPEASGEVIAGAFTEGLIMSSIYAGGYDLVTGGKAFGGGQFAEPESDYGWGKERGVDIWVSDPEVATYYQQYLGTANSQETIYKLEQIQHNGEGRLLDGFVNAVDEGDISVLVGFDGYVETAHKADQALTGKETADGLLIRGYETHFIDRVIGQTDEAHAGMRQGVPLEDVLDALERPVSIKNKQHPTGMPSRVYIGEKCKVTFNPQTGMLIQVNPK